MSMMGWVLGVTPAQMRAFRANPDLAGEVAIAAEEGRHEMAEAPGPLARPLGLEKSWHLLHYAFTGTAGPSGMPAGALMDGEEMGKDFGYGPARLLGVDATRAFSDFLRNVDVHQLQTRMNATQMEHDGVYAAPGDDGEVREEFELYFPQLREYVHRMADEHGGLLVWIS